MRQDGNTGQSWLGKRVTAKCRIYFPFSGAAAHVAYAADTFSIGAAAGDTRRLWITLRGKHRMTGVYYSEQSTRKGIRFRGRAAPPPRAKLFCRNPAPRTSRCRRYDLLFLAPATDSPFPQQLHFLTGLSFAPARCCEHHGRLSTPHFHRALVGPEMRGVSQIRRSFFIVLSPEFASQRDANRGAVK